MALLRRYGALCTESKVPCTLRPFMWHESFTRRASLIHMMEMTDSCPSMSLHVDAVCCSVSHFVSDSYDVHDSLRSKHAECVSQCVGLFCRDTYTCTILTLMSLTLSTASTRSALYPSPWGNACVWHEAFIRETWLIHIMDMTYSYVWHHSSTASTRSAVYPSPWSNSGKGHTW